MVFQVEFECDISLAALDQVPEPEAIRAFWNVKENDVLGGVPTRDRLWLGRTRPDEPRSPGPAGHVHDLLFFLGTTPDYIAPQITEELIEQVMTAFTSADDPELTAVDPNTLRDFLDDHRGGYLLCEG